MAGRGQRLAGAARLRRHTRACLSSTKSVQEPLQRRPPLSAGPGGPRPRLSQLTRPALLGAGTEQLVATPGGADALDKHRASWRAWDHAAWPRQEGAAGAPGPAQSQPGGPGRPSSD